jgi:DNA-binding LacI/PurR family transcriptional regulator
MPSTTLKTIAEYTGFSVTTVSRALGGFDDVNAETRDLIIAEAKRLGYEPNQQARALQRQKTNTIGFILPAGGTRFSDPFFGEFIAGIGAAATEAGFDLLVSTPSQAQPELAVYRRMVAGRRVDGLVMMRVAISDPRIEYLSKTHLPFAAFGRTAHHASYLHIDVDGVAGQAAMTQHLLDIGHRHIAYITPPRNLMFTVYRLQGFEQAMQTNGLAVNHSLICEGDLTEASGLVLAHDLLQRTPMPTAIMTGNDSMAIGVMKAVQERGLRVGADVAVGGYDDIPAAAHLHPSLTTIRQPIFEIGQQLTHMLLERIAGRDIASPAVLIQPQLLTRESTDPRHGVNGKGGGLSFKV